ncbi:MAG: alpha/beta hydrolase fold domain-containing protein [Kiritimatiellaeota bacterium]|nr:alpha/beta hydrolase fold domain-containing protein [Kiritimatiellota bacterium]
MNELKALVIGGLIMSSAVEGESAIGQVAKSDGLTWRPAYQQPFQLLGFKWFEENGRVYCRLPVDPGVPVRKPVMALAHHTAGGQVRFRTDSRRVIVRAELAGFGNMDHMARTGQDGFDLYVGPPGREQFVGVTRIRGSKIEQGLFHRSTRELRSFRLNFPLYCGVRSVEIGLDQGARLLPPEPLEDDRCIVVYGTSITQGGCASRPGTAWTNILSRRLNREVVNLGFSGNGKGERELAVLINRISRKRMVVLDYEANAGDGIRTTLGPFIQTLRAADPSLPIVVISKIRYAREVLDPKALRAREALRDFERKLVDGLRKKGDRFIWFLDGTGLLGPEWWEGTVDGTHPTDYGMWQIAEHTAPFIRKLLLQLRVDEAPGSVIRLWPGGNPGGWRNPEPETVVRSGGVTRIHNVNDPTLTRYIPDRSTANGSAVVICPGGGYRILAWDLEGEEIARRLCAEGYQAFILKYRLPRPELDSVRYAAALQDAQRALRLVRAHATEWGVEKVGIMGFSAGAHLSAVTAAQWRTPTYPAVDSTDTQSCRPDFVGLIYPAFLVKDQKTGELAGEVSISEEMPPVFLVQTEDDNIHVENSLFFYRALKDHGVPAQLHTYEQGPHGYGLRAGDKAVGAWIDLFEAWLARQ